MTFQTHNDARSRAIVEAFRERLAPLMADLAPDWLMHHIKVIHQSQAGNPLSEEVVVQLVLRPIGNVREAHDSGSDGERHPLAQLSLPEVSTVSATRSLPR